jgi:hypothetical protein
MNPNHELWNDRHKQLRDILRQPDEFEHAIPILLDQHAMVNSAEMCDSKLWSFEDEIWEGLSEPQIREVPKGEIHSIAWLIWHIARIEDVTMNCLVSGSGQVFTSDRWQEKIHSPILHVGNEMNVEEVQAFSADIRADALKHYRMAVSRRTREVIAGLKPDDLRKKVARERVDQVTAQGWILPGAVDVIEYWAKLDIAGFLLMPPTRHCFIHLNEALQVKEKLRG